MKKNILVAPLNWGLGHASRCVPIIDGLLKLGHHVTLASDGDAKKLLEIEFPSLPILELPSYGISYPKNDHFIWHMVKNAPMIMSAIQKEKLVLENLLKVQKIDVVISDNRYGLFSKKVRSVIITHQVQIALPYFQNIASALVQQKLKNFNAIWVPDEAGTSNLSGMLSHGKAKDLPVEYIGVLSRMENSISKPIADFPFNQGFVLAIISGPEPQRSIFEELILNQAKKLSQNIVIVGGSFKESKMRVNDNIYSISFANSSQLKWLINQSSAVISRSGYSTIMDLVVLKKCAILVSTPGQTEQEYLATYLKKKEVFVIQNQKNLNLELAISQLQKMEWNQALNGISKGSQLMPVLTRI